jgi:hypothetical protein
MGILYFSSMFMMGQIDDFLNGHVIGEVDLHLGVFPASTKEVFEGIFV